MKKLLIIFSFTLALGISSAQELLWNTFKYSDGLVAIPSMAGLKGGAIIANQRWNWSGIEGAPVSSMLAGHSTFLQNKVGGGIVFVAESVNFLSNYRLSIPLSYHLEASKTVSLSFGLSPEMVLYSIDAGKITNEVVDDELLNTPNTSFMDFGFSAQVNNDYFEIGASITRFRSFSNGNLPSNLMLFANLFIPLKDEYDLLEPTLVVFQDNTGSWYVFGSLYYMLFDKIIIGTGYLSSERVFGSIGLSIHNRYILGYNYEQNINSLNSALGNSHEITLRYNLNQRYYNQRKYSMLAKPIGGMSTGKR